MMPQGEPPPEVTYDKLPVTLFTGGERSVLALVVPALHTRRG